MASLGFIEIGELTEEKEAYIIYEGKYLKMPRQGHRDVNTKTFAMEVDLLLNITKQTTR
jgi:hypothetical protein